MFNMTAVQAAGVALCAVGLVLVLTPELPDTPLWMRAEWVDLSKSFHAGATERWSPVGDINTVADFVTETDPETATWWRFGMPNRMDDPLALLDRIEERLSRLETGVEFVALVARLQGEHAHA